MSRSIRHAKPDYLALIAVSLVYLALILIASPFHEFPLNDDVMYAEAVRTLLETGRLQFSPWVAPALILQVAYGAAVSKLLAFSFTTLHLTTLVLSWIGTSTLYLFLRTLDLDRVLSLCGALTLALNPVYLNLSYTFMTEVPFVAFLVLSLLCYIRGLTHDSDAGVLAGSIFATAGLLIRQVGIVVPFAAALSILLGGAGGGKNRKWRLLLLSAGIPLVSFAAYVVWLRTVHGPTRALGAFFTPSVLFNPVRLAPMVLDHGFVTLEYLGLFIVPLLPLWLGGKRSGLLEAVSPRLLLSWTGLIASGALLMYLVHGKIMPYTGNVLHPAGVGTLTLKDVVFDGRLPLLRLPRSFWGLVTLLASSGAILVGSLLSRLGVRLLAGWREDSRRPGVLDRPTLWMLGLALLGFFGVGLITRHLFDRYFIPLLVLLIPLLLSTTPAPQWKSWGMAGALVLLLGYGTFGALGTRDYLAWNGARWAGIHYLMSEEHVNPSEMDAGYEANYWYNYANAETQADAWWWVVDPVFYFTFTPLEGYEVAMIIPYRRSLPPPGVEHIYVLYRNGSEGTR